MSSEAARQQRLQLRVRGRVQGVGFRAYAQYVAERFALVGWVRNVGASEVEAVAEGPRHALDDFAAALRRGPPGSRVDDATLAWQAASGEFRRFDVRPSAPG